MSARGIEVKLSTVGSAGNKKVSSPLPSLMQKHVGVLPVSVGVILSGGPGVRRPVHGG